jgi:aryl-alcohol dehydrogenase-like predicted oxidoreductase
MADSASLETRPFGDTGLRVAPLGLAGSFGIGADDVERAFHELGINYFFVTKRMKGLSEGVRRLVAAGHRDDIVIATGASIPTGGQVRSAWESEARNLGVDRVEVFHLFWVQFHWYVTGKTWPAMQRLREEGKAGALAISCHDRPMARSLCDELDLDVLMCRYNAAHRGAEGDIFDSLPRARPAVVAYTATRWGKLLEPIDDLPAMSPGECYRFAISHPRVDAVLCGAGSYAELAANAAAVGLGPLDPARMEEVRQFGSRVRAKVSSRLGFVGS